MFHVDSFHAIILKEVVFCRQSIDVEDLKNERRFECNFITKNIIRAVSTRELLRRFKACVTSNGGHFKYKI